MTAQVNKMVQRGAFIVFEGCDRAGKSTQCKMLVEALNKASIPAEYMNFPDRSTSIGQLISKYLSREMEIPDKAIHLLFSANRWELEPVIQKKLRNGISLVVDRYSFSGVAYSAAKKNMDLEWCWNPEIGLPKPDAVFFLHLEEQDILRRGGFGEERYERISFQRKVLNNYLALKDSSWKVIDAEKDVETLHSILLAEFMDVYHRSIGSSVEIQSRVSPKINNDSVLKPKNTLF